MKILGYILAAIIIFFGGIIAICGGISLLESFVVSAGKTAIFPLSCLLIGLSVIYFRYLSPSNSGNKYHSNNKIILLCMAVVILFGFLIIFFNSL